ncbi:hypothetical protein [Fischerella muscicola]
MKKKNRVDTKWLPVRVGHEGIGVWDISCVRPTNDKISSFILSSVKT